MPVIIPTPPVRSQLAITARGFLSESAPIGVLNSNLAPATQIVYYALLGLRAGDVVTNLHCALQTAAAGADPTLVKMGLYSTAGTRLAQSANLASDAMWDSTGIKTVPLSPGAYTVTADGGYYAAFLIDGTFGGTNLQLVRQNSTGAAAGALGANAGSAFQQTGQTDLPSPGTLTASGSTYFWMAVS